MIVSGVVERVVRAAPADYLAASSRSISGWESKNMAVPAVLVKGRQRTQTSTLRANFMVMNPSVSVIWVTLCKYSISQLRYFVNSFK